MTNNINSLKMNALSKIAEETQEKVKNVWDCYNEARKILNKFEGFNWGKCEEDDVNFYLGEGNRYIQISEIKDKAIYSNMLMALTDIYGEGKRDKTWDNEIRYTFNKTPNSWRQDIEVTLKVSTELTGCRLLIEDVVIPQKVEPEHIEHKTVIKCD
jgi:hypothetical protein